MVQDLEVSLVIYWLYFCIRPSLEIIIGCSNVVLVLLLQDKLLESV